MKVVEIGSQLVYDVYGVSREVEQMPSRNYSEVVTWFLIWTGANWQWIQSTRFKPYNDSLDYTGPG